MLGWIKIERNEGVLSAIRDELNRIEGPHDHYEGQNECSICDEHLLDAVLRLLKQLPTKEG